MEFFDVLNPLYAAPIVAVVFCAFLVYAFGFRSPVQPPSFEGIEDEKKFLKKRKIKDGQKGRHQNGKLNANLVKNIDNSNAGNKRKGAVEKSGKIELKVGKKVNCVTMERKKISSMKEISPAAEDGNDEGWVHLVSKKVRKNRKKDDSYLNDETSTPVLEINTPVAYIPDESKECTTGGHLNALTTEQNHENLPDIVKQGLIEDSVSGKCKIAAKQDHNQKLNLTKNDDEFFSSEKSQEYIAINNEKSSKFRFVYPSSLDIDSSEFESLMFCETKNAPKDQKQPKKKKTKKKSMDVLEKEKLSNSRPSETPSIVSSKTINNVELSAFSSTELNGGKNNIKEPDVIENSSIGLGKLCEDIIDDHDVDTSAKKLAHVAFDELAMAPSNVDSHKKMFALYPEEKAQKKKKKVRREH